ncbi:MAG: TAT-variant-translocated molybdopterin oxidoreductase [Blastocatellia bacterium]|nr:TAT-variant-translocated molybdopterin oxidoreductase [Blastocatellia bacterium]
MSQKDQNHDIAPIQIEGKLKLKKGLEYWRSLEELADTERFRQFLHREFPALDAPEADPSMLDPVGRRNFLKLMSASIAFAGLTACTRQPQENIVPYVKTPDGLIPGKPQFFATAMTTGGVANGLLVESHEGRPTKIEGNVVHPGSKGGTTVYEQASILELYDPDRSQSTLYVGDPRTWGDFLNALRAALDGQRSKQGAGLRILTETVTSPTLASQMKKLLELYPQAKWHVYEPASRDGARMGANLVYGQFVNTVYRFDKADIVLSLDADFLTNGPGSVRYARDFIDKRRLVDGSNEMNRLYVVESTLTTTGAKADHRLPIKASDVDSFARAVAAAIGVTLPTSGTFKAEKFVDAVAKDLNAHRGKSIVIAGEHQPASVHAIAHAINNALGNIGETVVITEPIEANPVDQIASLAELVADMNTTLPNENTSVKVDLLVIIGANPVYNAPLIKDEKTGREVTFLEAMQKVGLRIHHGLFNDETAANCHWHVAGTHYLESWGDARAYDGTVSIIQPLIIPLYSGKSTHELVAAMVGEAGKTDYDIVKEHWKAQSGASFEQDWKQWLNDGIVANTALPPKTVALKADWASALKPAATGTRTKSYEIVFRLDPNLHDGRFANNSWLQELPKPLSKITWDNYAIISSRTANDLGLAPNDEPYQANAKMIKLKHEGKELTMPAWVQPGHPDDTVTIYLGYGRQRAGNVGNNIGFPSYSLRTANAPWIATQAVDFEVGEGNYQLASTQEHFNIETSKISGIGSDAFIEGRYDLVDRHIVRTATLEQYKKDPHFVNRDVEVPDKDLTMYPPWKYPGYAWGMSIDMNACIGCNACVVACYSENNIAVVGKEMVRKGRIMHWLRIDTYFKGEMVNPKVYFQPMMCQHCENAPCELVCPVNATVHDAEGLNVQVYNRCVGTRYCSNNCPYKVRRFNYLLYGDWETPSLKNARNPEVTVRSRGVMEKCTFCVQRIMSAKIESEKQDRKVRDGEIMTACQSACPTEAIIFGDINDEQSRVYLRKKEPRNYSLLADLNTRPRASYLAPITNPNGELGDRSSQGMRDDDQKSGEVKHG